MGILYGLFAAIFWGVGDFLITHLTRRVGTLLALAAIQVLSLLGWMLILSVPAGALLAERLKRPDLQLVASFGILAIAAATLPVNTDNVMKIQAGMRRAGRVGAPVTNIRSSQRTEALTRPARHGAGDAMLLS